MAFASETLQWTDHRDLHQCRPAACGAPACGTRVSTDRWHFDRSGDGATQRRTSLRRRDGATAIRRLGANPENAGGTSAVVPMLRVKVPERWTAVRCVMRFANRIAVGARRSSGGGGTTAIWVPRCSGQAYFPRRPPGRPATARGFPFAPPSRGRARSARRERVGIAAPAPCPSPRSR